MAGNRVCRAGNIFYAVSGAMVRFGKTRGKHDSHCILVFKSCERPDSFLLCRTQTGSGFHPWAKLWCFYILKEPCLNQKKEAAQTASLKENYNKS